MTTSVPVFFSSAMRSAGGAAPGASGARTRSAHRPLADIAALAERIFTETDDEVDSWFPEKIGGRVRIDFSDGSFEEELVEDCRGTPGNPMSAQELDAKARAVASMSMAEAKFDRLIATVRCLEDLEDARELGDALRG